jgi:hypothetical protein
VSYVVSRVTSKDTTCTIVTNTATWPPYFNKILQLFRNCEEWGILNSGVSGACRVNIKWVVKGNSKTLIWYCGAKVRYYEAPCRLSVIRAYTNTNCFDSNNNWESEHFSELMIQTKVRYFYETHQRNSCRKYLYLKMCRIGNYWTDFDKT